MCNAIKFAPKSTSIHIARSALPGSLEVSVTDAGPGIPEAALATLFNRYTRASDNGVVQASGSGLGLMIVREIIESHGGSVGVDAQNGTRFWFCLPTATA